jgi:hypothetical protein
MPQRGVLLVEKRINGYTNPGGVACSFRSSRLLQAAPPELVIHLFISFYKQGASLRLVGLALGC